eukprot:scaffold4094_cov201-Ochromonas_danica.AAC.2
MSDYCDENLLDDCNRMVNIYIESVRRLDFMSCLVQGRKTTNSTSFNNNSNRINSPSINRNSPSGGSSPSGAGFGGFFPDSPRVSKERTL